MTDPLLSPAELAEKAFHAHVEDPESDLEVSLTLSDLEKLLEQAAAYGATEPVCVMTHTEPFDFAQCETHDTTFALGQACKFNGRQVWEVYADEADAQRMRAVRAEHERENDQLTVAEAILDLTDTIEKRHADAATIGDDDRIFFMHATAGMSIALDGIRGTVPATKLQYAHQMREHQRQAPGARPRSR